MSNLRWDTENGLITNLFCGELLVGWYAPGYIEDGCSFMNLFDEERDDIVFIAVFSDPVEWGAIEETFTTEEEAREWLVDSFYNMLQRANLQIKGD